MQKKDENANKKVLPGAGRESGDSMKTKSRVYLTAIECAQLRKTRVYESRSRRREQAMRKSQSRFVAEFPQALNRNLTIGGFVTTLRSARRLYGRASEAWREMGGSEGRK